MSLSAFIASAKWDWDMGCRRDIVIVGGCGRVGLPLGIVFADAGMAVALYDVNPVAVDCVRAGKMPFQEAGAQEILERLVSSERLVPTLDPAVVSDAEHVIVVIGTPVDEHLNPDLKCVTRAIEDLLPHLRPGQHLVLRSTVYPGVTSMVAKQVAAAGLDVDVSFCPERIAEGKAMEELRQLPQIVAGCSPRSVERSTELFGHLTSKVVHLDVEEAELAKLFTNTWRYIKFAAANQMFMIANDFGLDFEKIRGALTDSYPRAADLPGPGLAAGPCLLKDTMQLASFHENNFALGHASMIINEGLPLYLIGRLERRFDLSSMTVGILGMAFKAESDDIRSSLSYKLKRALKFKAARVLCTDPYVQNDSDLVALDVVLQQSDVLLIGAPHRAYVDIDVDVPIVDVWNHLGSGVLT
jgi:UDP-N-acetyl-D-mannosaminuronic acid dehydrogenase